MSPPGKNAAAICSCQRGPELWADSLYMNYRGWASWVMKPCEQRDKSRIPGAEWIFSIRLVSNNQHTQAIGTVGDVHLGCVAHKSPASNSQGVTNHPKIQEVQILAHPQSGGLSHWARAEWESVVFAGFRRSSNTTPATSPCFEGSMLISKTRVFAGVLFLEIPMVHGKYHFGLTSYPNKSSGYVGMCQDAGSPPKCWCYFSLPINQPNKRHLYKDASTHLVWAVHLPCDSYSLQMFNPTRGPGKGGPLKKHGFHASYV